MPTYIDKNGNIRDQRSGNIEKHWVEINHATGTGEYKTLNKVQYDEENKADWDMEYREKMKNKAKNLYNCKKCKHNLEYKHFSGSGCEFNYLGDDDWMYWITNEYTPARIMRVKKGEIYPKKCELFIE